MVTNSPLGYIKNKKQKQRSKLIMEIKSIIIKRNKKHIVLLEVVK